MNVIKANIQSRAASLQEGTHQVSLFHVDALSCNALYLEPNQEHAKHTNLTGVILSVFEGTGELYCEGDDGQTIVVHLTQGDTVFVPEHVAYKIINVAKNRLMISELLINTL